MSADRLPARQVVQNRLGELGIRPHEALGQHFLVNDGAIDKLASQVLAGGRVIEVGSGIGHVTEAIADRAGIVTGIEIDRRYAPVLDRIADERDNVKIVYGDALTFPWERHNPKKKGEETDLQIVANLPYHISEPFMRRLVTLNIDSAVLMLGKKLIDEVQAPTPESINFGTLTLLAQAFFTMEQLGVYGRDDFFPPPRTESGLLKFSPRDTRFDPLSRRDYIFRTLFMTERRNPSLASVLKDELIAFESRSSNGTTGKKEKNRNSRRQTRMDLRQAAREYGSGNRQPEDRPNALVKSQQRVMDWVRDRGVTDAMLHKPFHALDNSEIRKLAIALS